MKCTSCGRELEEGKKFCPYCGAKQINVDSIQNQKVQNRQKAPKNSMCIIGITLALVALLLGLGESGGFLAAGVSIYGFMQCKEKDEGGKWLAVAGIVIGILVMKGAQIDAELQAGSWWW